VIHVRREANLAAHVLVRAAVTQVIYSIWLEEILPFIYDIVLRECIAPSMLTHWVFILSMKISYVIKKKKKSYLIVVYRYPREIYIYIYIYIYSKSFSKLKLLSSPYPKSIIEFLFKLPIKKNFYLNSSILVNIKQKMSLQKKNKRCVNCSI
jgi:hypothetical protein